MSATLAPSRVVPAEYRGLARQFRDRIAQEDDPARLMLAGLVRPITERIKQRRLLTPRSEVLAGVADQWRRKFPQRGRLDLCIAVDLRRKTLLIDETRLTASAYRDRLWDRSEIGLILLAVRLDVGPRRYEIGTKTLAHVSLHALARRFQRGSDVGEDAIKRDLLALREAHPGLTDLANGADVFVQVVDGSWRGNVALMDNSRGGVHVALAVRTFLAR